MDKGEEGCPAPHRATVSHNDTNLTPHIYNARNLWYVTVVNTSNNNSKWHNCAMSERGNFMRLNSWSGTATQQPLSFMQVVASAADHSTAERSDTPHLRK